MSRFLVRLQSESNVLLNPDRRNDPTLQRSWIKSEIFNPELNLANTNQTKPVPSHWQDQDPQLSRQQRCQCCDTAKWWNKWGRSRKIFTSSNCAERPALLRFLIFVRWDATRAYCSHCGRGILQLIWYIEVCFLACHRHGHFLLLHSSPWMIRSRLNTIDELPKSPLSTRMERCSNVPLHPRHGLFIVFAEGVTLKNKNRSSFSVAEPLIRAAVFATR